MVVFDRVEYIKYVEPIRSRLKEPDVPNGVLAPTALLPTVAKSHSSTSPQKLLHYVTDS